MTIVVLAPLPFASNRPWSWSLLSLAVGLISCVWAWIAAQASEPPAVSLRLLRIPAVLFLAVCAFAILQTIPIAAPGYANPIWLFAQQAGIDGITPTISISPHATWTALMRLIAYGLVFWLVLQTCRSPAKADQAMAIIAWAAAVYAAYGILARLSNVQTILWFEKWAYLDSVTGTVVNRNTFATFVGLGLLCILARLIRQFVHRGGMRRNPVQAGPFARGSQFDLFVSISAVICLIAALLLTQSRAGILCTALSTIVFLLGVAYRSRNMRFLTIVSTGLALLVILFLAASGRGLFDRLGQLVAGEGEVLTRVDIYKSTLRAIGDHPLVGFGYGTFEDSFAIYRSERTHLYFDKAHNTYLELAIGLGIPMTVALVLAVTLIALRCVRGFNRRRSLYVYPWAAFCATTLVALHALVDFSVQLPAVAVQFATILAIGCAQSWSSRIDTSKPQEIICGLSPVRRLWVSTRRKRGLRHE